MPKLQVCERGPIAVSIKGVVKRFNPGQVFEIADEKEAERLLGITPAIVQKPGIVKQVADAIKGKGKGKSKKDEPEDNGDE